VSQAQKLWRQIFFQGTQKSKQTTSKIVLILNLNIKDKNKKQKYEMYKIKVQILFYSNNIWKHEHEMK
jgi:hypothetical protein